MANKLNRVRRLLILLLFTVLGSRTASIIEFDGHESSSLMEPESVLRGSVNVDGALRELLPVYRRQWMPALQRFLNERVTDFDQEERTGTCCEPGTFGARVRLALRGFYLEETKLSSEGNANENGERGGGLRLEADDEGLGPNAVRLTLTTGPLKGGFSEMRQATGFALGDGWNKQRDYDDDEVNSRRGKLECSYSSRLQLDLPRGVSSSVILTVIPGTREFEMQPEFGRVDEQPPELRLSLLPVTTEAAVTTTTTTTALCDVVTGLVATILQALGEFLKRRLSEGLWSLFREFLDNRGGWPSMKLWVPTLPVLSLPPGGIGTNQLEVHPWLFTSLGLRERRDLVVEGTIGLRAKLEAPSWRAGSSQVAILDGGIGFDPKLQEEDENIKNYDVSDDNLFVSPLQLDIGVGGINGVVRTLWYLGWAVLSKEEDVSSSRSPLCKVWRTDDNNILSNADGNDPCPFPPLQKTFRIWDPRYWVISALLFPQLPQYMSYTTEMVVGPPSFSFDADGVGVSGNATASWMLLGTSRDYSIASAYTSTSTSTEKRSTSKPLLRADASLGFETSLRPPRSLPKFAVQQVRLDVLSDGAVPLAVRSFETLIDFWDSSVRPTVDRLLQSVLEGMMSIREAFPEFPPIDDVPIVGRSLQPRVLKVDDDLDPDRINNGNSEEEEDSSLLRGVPPNGVGGGHLSIQRNYVLETTTIVGNINATANVSRQEEGGEHEYEHDEVSSSNKNDLSRTLLQWAEEAGHNPNAGFSWSVVLRTPDDDGAKFITKEESRAYRFESALLVEAKTGTMLLVP